MSYSSFEKNIEDMGLLAKFVYAQNFSQLEKNLPNTYKVEYFNSNYSSGFAGALLRDKNSGNYIIAFRGTDELVDSLSWIGENTPQYQDAKNFVFDMIIKYGIDKSNLTITGHSLGGILTVQIVSELHLKGYAYNPFGANLLSYKRYKKYANVINDWANKNIYTISYQDEGLING